MQDNSVMMKRIQQFSSIPNVFSKATFSDPCVIKRCIS